MNSYFRPSDSEKVLEVLREIESNPQVTQRYLAQKHNTSLGKINFLINALLERGVIKANRFKNSKKKIGYIYIMTPEGIKMRVELVQRFLAIKLREYETLKKEIDKISEHQESELKKS